MAAIVPEFPVAQADILQSIVCELRTRAKGFKYNLKRWSIDVSRELEVERLDIETVDLFCHQSCLSVWSTGDMWFRLCKPGPRKFGGWEQNFAFQLWTSHNQPAKLVQTFKRTRSMHNRDACFAEWSDFNPRIDKSVTL